MTIATIARPAMSRRAMFLSPLVVPVCRTLFYYIPKELSGTRGLERGDELLRPRAQELRVSRVDSAGRAELPARADCDRPRREPVGDVARAHSAGRHDADLGERPAQGSEQPWTTERGREQLHERAATSGSRQLGRRQHARQRRNAEARRRVEDLLVDVRRDEEARP